MKNKEPLPSEVISAFVKKIKEYTSLYNRAHELVKYEESRLQDLLHSLEFSDGKSRYAAAKELQESRKIRRKNKDDMIMYMDIIEFFSSPGHAKTLKAMERLIGDQRHQEKFLSGERTYTPKVVERNDHEKTEHEKD